MNPVRRAKAWLWTVRDRRRRKRIRAKLAEVGNREPEFADYMKNRRDWLYQHLPEASAEFIYDLHSKRKQKAMAQRVGIPVATEYVSASPLTAVLDELATGTYAEAVLKPIHGRGGAGVFCLVREGDAFRELKSGKMHDIKRLKRIAEDSYQYMRRADEWILEELLLYPGDPTEPARDVKFYCFGGRTELVLQKGMVLDGRGRRVVKRRFFDRDGSPVDPGLRPNEIGGDLSLSGRYEELLAEAERVAGMITTPFMRVDLYDAHRGVVLGEFTASAGGMYKLNLEWKDRFTRRWHEAAAALELALLTGEAQPLMPDPDDPAEGGAALTSSVALVASGW